ncbi:Predicted arabinose efflux permease, MFS family [Asanoa hainanensis]|uniref:Predicted arabinose efflux permease, MFS family n=1 Tax=Asanoa hainanensis TaxID=560556 RepID=A0A239IXE3_9ACTN|nr:MFS transporter [Asanoa hainanensis]SNS97888.1 Predicted arabinose efflux permease, MFS family [Asanoa hainanensis]
MTTMTMTATPVRPRLVTRPLMLLSAADFLGLTSFYALLSVVPAYVSGGVGAGLATGTLMLTTVAAELALPRLVARFGYRAVLAAGLLLLGLPALALPFSAGLPMVLAVCVLRGAGLAAIFVVCGAWGAELVPAQRRGEGLGLLGVVAGVPAIVGMPAGLWLATQVGFDAVFVAGAVLALLGLAALPTLPGGTGQGDATGVVAALRTPALVRPSIVFAGAAMLSGIVATFLPQALPHTGEGFVAIALLVHAVTGTAARWWAGVFGDRHGAHRLLVPGVVTGAAGLAVLVVTTHPVAVLIGMAVFGAGFGTVQNASMAVLLQATSPSRYGVVTALWSVAYDTGFGAGALGFGLLATTTGYPVGFAAAAALSVAALVVLRRVR